MKKPFKVGDRVAVYNSMSSTGCIRYVGVLFYLNHVTGYCEVNTDDGVEQRGFHIKQCHRLVKKERRRVWVNKDLLDIRSDDTFKGYLVPGLGLTEFIEVKKK